MPTRLRRRYGRKWKGKGNGKKAKHMFFKFRLGKGNKTNGNFIGRNGKKMLCSLCSSSDHVRIECPENFVNKGKALTWLTHDDHYDDWKGEWSVPTTSWSTHHYGRTKWRRKWSGAGIFASYSFLITDDTTVIIQIHKAQMISGLIGSAILTSSQTSIRHKPDDSLNWQHRPLLNKTLHNACPFATSSVHHSILLTPFTGRRASIITVPARNQSAMILRCSGPCWRWTRGPRTNK